MLFLKNRTWELIMTFKFYNYSLRTERKRFKWKVFMDETAVKLAQVQSVEYRLHETFEKTIWTIEDRNSQFALEGDGWGEFTIYITIYLKDGTEEYTAYNLDLNKPAGDLSSQTIT
jgi:transcription initiation factor IIF auxiliary subunit